MKSFKTFRQGSSL